MNQIENKKHGQGKKNEIFHRFLWDLKLQVNKKTGVKSLYVDFAWNGGDNRYVKRTLEERFLKQECL